VIRRGAAAGDRFVQILNAAMQDQRLSYRARGILASVLSRPLDWRTSAEQLAQESPKEGREAIQGALRELEATGYLTRARRHNPAGQIRVVWEITDTPGGSPNAETLPIEHPESTPQTRRSEPSTGLPTSAEPSPVNPSTNKHRTTNTKSNPAFGDAPNPPAAPVKAVPDGTGQQAGGPKPAKPEDVVAKTVYDTLDGGVTYIKVRQIAKHFLGRGRRPDDVAEAMLTVRNARRPITVETVHDALRDLPAQDSGLDYDVQQWRMR
jgi:hypothetical protein